MTFWHGFVIGFGVGIALLCVMVFMIEQWKLKDPPGPQRAEARPDKPPPKPSDAYQSSVPPWARNPRRK